MAASKLQQVTDFYRNGWCRVPYDASIAAWVDAAKPAAQAAVNDPAFAQWLRHGKTWFAGVNALPNDGAGRVHSSGPMPKPILKTLENLDLAFTTWDRAQISVIYPGYPQQDPGETDTAHRFRRNRDAAHVDGLLPVGPTRRRMLQEPHSFVLGIPLSQTAASPLVVWNQSHTLMQQALGQVLNQHAPNDWPTIDITDAYQAARRTAFNICQRVTVTARPGEAYVVHRLALHGVAPWKPTDTAPPEGRMIAYFRPELPMGGPDWISAR